MTIAVLDVGKTHVRLAAVDERGEALEMLQRDNAVIAGPPYPHFDVEAVFAWLIDALAALAPRHAFTEIVPVAHGACAAVLAGDALALPVLDYEFSAPEGIADYEKVARRFDETFSPRLPAGLNLGRQLAWLAATFPRDFARADRVLLLPQYWAWRLSGVAASERTSLGCHTDLWAPLRDEFSAFARESEFAARLPPLAEAWRPLGPLRADLADRIGVRAECRVLAGIHDSNASYLAHRAGRSEPFAVVSSGTWTVVMAHGGDLRRLDEARDTLANVDAFGAPVATARFMGGREFAEIAGEGGREIETTDAELLATIERGDLALPTFAPGVGPYPGATASLHLAAPSDPRARASLAALYCALVTDVCLELAGASGDIVVEGPFARNRGYLAALAGLRADQCVVASPDATGSLAGAAILARRARGEALVLRESRVGLAVTPFSPRALAGYRVRWRERLG